MKELNAVETLPIFVILVTVPEKDLCCEYDGKLLVCELWMWTMFALRKSTRTFLSLRQKSVVCERIHVELQNLLFQNGHRMPMLSLCWKKWLYEFARHFCMKILHLTAQALNQGRDKFCSRRYYREVIKPFWILKLWKD